MAKRPDWTAIEREYRAGQLSNRELGKRFGVSDTAIRKKAAKEGWTRDLRQDVRRATAAKLAEADANEVREWEGGSQEVRTINARTEEREVIDAAAQRGADVIQTHRRDIHAAREMAIGIMHDLGEARANREAVMDAIADETAEDGTTQRRALMMRAVSVPEHAKAMRALAGALNHLVPLERRAFSLDEDDGAASEDFLGQLSRGRERARRASQSDSEG